MPSQKKHVLVISLSPTGHSGPTFELAKKISHHVSVTFAASAYLIDDLEKSLSHDPSCGQQLDFHRFDDGEKPDFNDPSSLQVLFKVLYPLVIEFIKDVAFSGGKEDGKSGLLPIDAIVADHFLAGALDHGFQRGIPIYLFNTPAVGLLRWCIMLDDDTPVVSMEDAPDFERIRKPDEPPFPVSDMVKQLFLPIRKVMPLAKGFLENSFLSVDLEGSKLVQADPEIGKIPLYFVGPLIPVPDKIAGSKESTDFAVRTWLAAQKSRSVVYISFGSMTVPGDEQVTEIAKALLLLNKPFIWSLKEQAHGHLPEEIRNKMATQFEPNSQFLILPWAPQKSILAHPSTATMLSHCGWNGTLESLSAGVPMVAYPMFADQLINAEWLVEHGIAVLIPGTGKRRGRTVPANEISAAISKVARSAIGGNNEFLEAAKHWAREAELALSMEGSSSKDLLRFVESL